MQNIIDPSRRKSSIPRRGTSLPCASRLPQGSRLALVWLLGAFMVCCMSSFSDTQMSLRDLLSFTWAPRQLMNRLRKMMKARVWIGFQVCRRALGADAPGAQDRLGPHPAAKHPQPTARPGQKVLKTRSEEVLRWRSCCVSDSWCYACWFLGLRFFWIIKVAFLYKLWVLRKAWRVRIARIEVGPYKQA